MAQVFLEDGEDSVYMGRHWTTKSLNDLYLKGHTQDICGRIKVLAPQRYSKCIVEYVANVPGGKLGCARSVVGEAGLTLEQLLDASFRTAGNKDHSNKRVEVIFVRPDDAPHTVDNTHFSIWEVV